MPFAMDCPSCRRKLNVPEELAGRKVKCPKCGAGMRVLSAGDNREPPPRRQAPFRQREEADDEAFASEAVVKGSGFRKSRELPDAEDDSDPIVREPAQPEQRQATASRVPLGLGVPALVLGIIGFGLTWVPFVGFLSLPLAGLGFLLGIAGLIVAIVQRGNGLGFTIAGSACSLVTLLTALFWLGIVGPFGGHATPAVATPALPPALKELGIGMEEPRAEVAKDQPPQEKDVAWTDVSKGPVSHGEVVVLIERVEVRNLRIKDLLGENTTDKPYLTIKVVVGNDGKSKKIPFKGWSGAQSVEGISETLKNLGGGGGLSVLGGSRALASVTDNFGNSYKRLSMEVGAEIPGQVSNETSIYPGKMVDDLLVFEPPVDDVKFLRLELPAAAFGGSGKLRLQIPRSMIHR